MPCKINVEDVYGGDCVHCPSFYCIYTVTLDGKTLKLPCIWMPLTQYFLFLVFSFFCVYCTMIFFKIFSPFSAKWFNNSCLLMYVCMSTHFVTNLHLQHLTRILKAWSCLFKSVTYLYIKHFNPPFSLHCVLFIFYLSVLLIHDLTFIPPSQV